MVLCQEPHLRLTHKIQHLLYTAIAWLALCRLYMGFGGLLHSCKKLVLAS